MTLERRLKLAKAILSNALRLRDDCAVLVANGRHKTAIVVGVLAIEELGKHLISKWDVKNVASKREFPTHIEKQSATFALLAADEITRLDQSGAATIQSCDTANFHDIGPLCSQFAWARAGFYEDLRTFALYHDEKSKWPKALERGLTEDMAHELLSYFDQARACRKNRDAMNLATIIFANDLGRL